MMEEVVKRWIVEVSESNSHSIQIVAHSQLAGREESGSAATVE